MTRHRRFTLLALLAIAFSLLLTGCPRAGLPTEHTRFISVTGGGYHSLALDRTGQAWAWGHNAHGQIGDGTSDHRLVPTAVTMPPGVTFTTIAAGNYHSLALDQNGRAWAWGRNSSGQIGDGTDDGDRVVPTAASMPPGVLFTAIAAGGSYSLALDRNGHAWAWGYNYYGQIGDGTYLNVRVVPTATTMPPGITFIAIAAGAAHALALDQHGRAWAWGWNRDGQIGDGTHDNFRLVPTAPLMPSGTTFSTIAAGNYHSLALDQNGHAWVWGSNPYGQAGDGTDDNLRLLPTATQMPANVTFTAIAGGSWHALALDQHGHAWVWGANNVGQAGDGTIGNRRLVPTAVTMAPGDAFAAVASGQFHPLGLDRHGRAWGWGSNGFGQVGDGTHDNSRLVPTAVHMP